MTSRSTVNQRGISLAGVMYTSHTIPPLNSTLGCHPLDRLLQERNYFQARLLSAPQAASTQSNELSPSAKHIPASDWLTNATTKPAASFCTKQERSVLHARNNKSQCSSKPLPLILGSHQHLLIHLSRMIPTQILLHAPDLDLPEAIPVVPVRLQSIQDSAAHLLSISTLKGPPSA